MIQLHLLVQRDGKLGESNVEHADAIVALLDHIEFSLQQVVRVGSLDAVDFTPELRVGQERSTFSYASSEAALGGRLLGLPADMRWTFQGTTQISLAVDDRPIKVQIARWWYLKSIAATRAIDCFLALWTALEVLARVDKFSVKESLRLACGHTVEQCTTCGKATTREINGLTMRGYLRQLGVSEEEANTMWSLRQAVHGKNLFGASQSRDLEKVLGLLRVTIFTSLRSHLDIGDEDLPRVVSTGGPVFGDISLEGHRPITPDDLALGDRLSTH
jgi:hypothetical protein